MSCMSRFSAVFSDSLHRLWVVWLRASIDWRDTLSSTMQPCGPSQHVFLLMLMFDPHVLMPILEGEHKTNKLAYMAQSLENPRFFHILNIYIYICFLWLFICLSTLCWLHMQIQCTMSPAFFQAFGDNTWVYFSHWHPSSLQLMGSLSFTSTKVFQVISGPQKFQESSRSSSWRCEVTLQKKHVPHVVPECTEV